MDTEKIINIKQAINLLFKGFTLFCENKTCGYIKTVQLSEDGNYFIYSIKYTKENKSGFERDNSYNSEVLDLDLKNHDFYILKTI